MKKLTIVFIFFTLAFSSFAQKKLVKFTLEDVIRIAKDQSPDAILAKHKFRASYWNNRSFRSIYLPSLTFSGTLPDLNRAYEKITVPVKDSITGKTISSREEFVERKYITNVARLRLNQNIWMTGGNIFINTDLNRNDLLGQKGSTSYLSTPLNIGLNQPLFSYNRLKWEKKLQPLLFEEAKKSYLDAMEGVALKAISRFFDLALAQLNLRIAQVNYNNSDTLFKIARGRYNIGTIAENDVLQMQLAFLNAKTSLNKAEIDLELQKARLRSFMGYNEKIDFDLILPDSIPTLGVNYQKVLELSMKNNPDVLARQRQLIEARRDVAQARGQRNTINLNASFGVNSETVKDIPSAYQPPFKERQQVQIGLTVPIIDWGQGKGRVRMAESNQELVNVQVQQAQADFEQNVFLQVMQFNLQSEQVITAAISDTIGQKRFDVTKQRFLIGKIDVLNLNDALREKDSAKRGYISALREYWNYFYTLRQLTLFDFIKDQALQEDFDKLVE